MKTRIIHTKIWKDQWFSSLSKDAKLLWQYLLSNEKINISGIYEISDREIVFDTSIETSVLDSLKKELEPKAVFFNGWVKVKNVEKYNKYQNSPMNRVAYERELSYIPDDVCAQFGIVANTSIYTSMHTLRNKESEIRTTKLEIRNGESPSMAKFRNIGEILKKNK